MSKSLHGWLKKKHTTAAGILGFKWGKRWVTVDETSGTLCYTKAMDLPSRVCLHLADVIAVESGAATGMPPSHFVVRCKGAYSFDHIEFCAGDREDAIMWVHQLRLRAVHWASVVAQRVGKSADAATTRRPADSSGVSSNGAPEVFTDSDNEDDEEVPHEPPPRTAQSTRTRHPATTVSTSATRRPPAGHTTALMPSGEGDGLVLQPSSLAFILEIGRLRADFVSEHEIELGCVAGELLLPLPWMTSPPGWIFAARPEGGAHGLVPAEYLELIQGHVHVPRALQSSSPARSSPSSTPLAAAAQGTPSLGAVVGALPPLPFTDLPPPPAASARHEEDDGAGVFGHRSTRRAHGSRAARVTVEQSSEPAAAAPPEPMEEEAAAQLAVGAQAAGKRTPPSPGKRRLQTSPPASPGKRKPPPQPQSREEDDVMLNETSPGTMASPPWLDGEADGEAPCVLAAQPPLADADEKVDEEVEEASRRKETAAEAARLQAEAARLQAERLAKAQAAAEAQAAEEAQARAAESAARAERQEAAERRRREKAEQVAAAEAAAEAEAAEAAAAEAAAAEAAAAEAAAAAAEEAARLVVAENNGVAIVADADFVGDDWDDEEDE